MNNLIYRHLKPNGEVFYIGIGKTKKRAYSKADRNKHWNHIVNKYGYSVEIVTTCDTREEACQIEQYLIKYYGRKDLGLGSLVNMTDGGEGTLGYEPWNKGIKGYMGANVTSFTKGNIPWNVGNKGHQPNQFTKLTEQQVLEIRSKFKPRVYTRKMLSLEYGVAETTIKDIVLRKSWTNI